MQPIIVTEAAQQLLDMIDVVMRGEETGIIKEPFNSKNNNCYAD
ncbi:MAG: hypothetical protein AAGE84_15165 [Cyanobacteria bacterium P01_G01_bin.39]